MFNAQDPKIDTDPYNGFVYTSFQERATFISHNNTAIQAKQYGDKRLATICKMIAADEKRHEIAYTKIMAKVFELDPSNAVLSFEEMMKKKITMPAHLMFDGEDNKLFENYAAVAQRLGVYTSSDYVEIMEHLIATWKVESLTGLSSDAQRAQDFLCNLPRRFKRLAERSQEQSRKREGPPVRKSFSWIFNKEVELM
jgi:acyl-[acyl-carrier-protein] desaturase